MVELRPKTVADLSLVWYLPFCVFKPFDIIHSQKPRYSKRFPFESLLTKNLYTFLFPPMRAICLTHVYLNSLCYRNNINNIMKLVIMKFFTLLLIRLCWAQIYFLLFHSQTSSLYSSLNLRGKVLHTPRRLYVLIHIYQQRQAINKCWIFTGLQFGFQSRMTLCSKQELSWTYIC